MREGARLLYRDSTLAGIGGTRVTLSTLAGVKRSSGLVPAAHPCRHVVSAASSERAAGLVAQLPMRPPLVLTLDGRAHEAALAAGAGLVGGGASLEQALDNVGCKVKRLEAGHLAALC